MQQSEGRLLGSVPFHITQRHRKYREFCQQHQDVRNQAHSLENMIEPIRRVRKKLPISGQYGNKKMERGTKKIEEKVRTKHSMQQLSLLHNYQAQQDNNHILPTYLRLKQIKRRNSLECDGPAYVKETDEQLQQRAKQFVKWMDSKKDKDRRSSLLQKRQCEQKLLDNEIRQCEKTIIQNQRLMQRQARVQQRIKYLKPQINRERYEIEQNQVPHWESRNSLHLQSKLSKHTAQMQHKHRLNRKSLNLSQHSSHRHDLFPQERVMTEADKCHDYFQNESRTMLKKLISLVQKKERSIYLSSIEAKPTYI